MNNLVEKYCNRFVDKKHQLADWREIQQRVELQEHATLDAGLHLLLYCRLVNLICYPAKNPS
jgi:ribonuclease D